MKQAIAAFLLCLSLVLGGVALAAHTLQEDAGQIAVTAISKSEYFPRILQIVSGTPKRSTR